MSHLRVVYPSQKKRPKNNDSELTMENIQFLTREQQKCWTVEFPLTTRLELTLSVQLSVSYSSQKSLVKVISCRILSYCNHTDVKLDWRK